MAFLYTIPIYFAVNSMGRSDRDVFCAPTAGNMKKLEYAQILGIWRFVH